MSDLQTTSPAPAPSADPAATQTPASPAAATAAAPTSQPATDPATAAATPGAATPTAADPAADPGKPQGAPEKYEFKAPEGKELDPELAGVFAEAARKADLPQEAAQQMLDTVAAAIEQKQERTLTAARTAWANEARTDPEIGGDKFDENLGVAIKAMESFASPELRELLKTSGLDTHPAMIKTFWKVGRAISEDGYVAGGKAATPPNLAQRMYPGMNP